MAERPDLIAYLPCPVKVPLEQAIAEYLETRGRPAISVQIEGNANKNVEDYALLIGANRAQDLPSLLIVPGVNQFFGRRFITEVLDGGLFRDVALYPRDPDLSGTALRDPLGHATVLAANVTLLVVDHTQMGTRPMPRSWRDLLAPEFASSVLMRGDGRTFCETTLLAWQELLGVEALAQMGRSIRAGWHPAQMAKIAGSGHESGAAAYVMPFFFARNIRHQDKVSLVWPKEGAIASPVTLFAKRHLTSELRQLAEWLAGPTVARLFSKAGLPTPHPEVGSGLPEGAGYLWSGWKRARSGDLSAELVAAEVAFASGHR